MNEDISNETIQLETIKNLSLYKQRLIKRPEKTDKETLMETIRSIKLLQLDSINVVARSHYLVMLSRVGLYKPSELDELLYPDRMLFEQWSHANCLIPAEDYPYLAPEIFERRNRPLRYGRLKGLGSNPEEILDKVLEEIKNKGPLSSKDFEDPRKEKGTWWNRKPARVALDVLFNQGYLMIEYRKNFQCYYNLAERILKKTKNNIKKNLSDYNKWATIRSLEALGTGTINQISDYYRQKTPIVKKIIESLKKEGMIIPLKVEGWKEETYILSSNTQLLKDIEKNKYKPSITTFLSPFDNLIWNRERTNKLFDFHYRIEVYTPEKERKYGYYVLPILHKNRMIGRIDPKSDRKNKKLIINKIFLEPKEKINDELLEGIIKALEEFSEFHENNEIIIKKTNPPKLKDELLKKIKTI